MVLASLRQEVLEANHELARRGLAVYTFGNASGISRADGLVVIKPSGVPYEQMKAEDLVVTDLEGRVVEGKLRPSSDLPTHLELYRAFAGAGGVVHTHSAFATAWAQAGREIPCLGTTHADYFHGPVPLTAPLEPAQIAGDYETNIGRAIARRFAAMDPLRTPAILVTGHGPFCWSSTAGHAACLAVILEEVARMAYYTVTLHSGAAPISQALMDRHFFRKHGPAATYGQR